MLAWYSAAQRRVALSLTGGSGVARRYAGTVPNSAATTVSNSAAGPVPERAASLKHTFPNGFHGNKPEIQELYTQRWRLWLQGNIRLSGQFYPIIIRLKPLF